MDEFDKIRNKITTYHSPLSLEKEWNTLLIKKENIALQKKVKNRNLILWLLPLLLLLLIGTCSYQKYINQNIDIKTTLKKEPIASVNERKTMEDNRPTTTIDALKKSTAKIEESVNNKNTFAPKKKDALVAQPKRAREIIKQIEKNKESDFSVNTEVIQQNKNKGIPQSETRTTSQSENKNTPASGNKPQQNNGTINPGKTTHLPKTIKTLKVATKKARGLAGSGLGASALRITPVDLKKRGSSPSYTDFEWEFIRIGYGYGNLSSGADNNSNGGFLVGGALRYNFRDNLSIGIRGETGTFGTGIIEGSNAITIDQGISRFFALTSDYYFRTDSPNRFFTGLGIGYYRSSKIEIINSERVEIFSAKSFGIQPRVGYELGNLRLEAQYNLSFKNEVTNYFGISAALVFWGGYQGE